MSTNEKKVWHGIPRDEIKWYPTIDRDTCAACLTCVNFCKQGVYAVKDGRPVVNHPENCVVGCRGCDGVCPMGAITHPSDEYLQELEKQKKDDTISDCCSQCKR